MSRKITMARWFRREEIDLMKRCLEDIVSGRFIPDYELYLISGWKISQYLELLERFDTVAFKERALTQEDYEMIFQSVINLSNYPVQRPRELELLVSTAPLHLSWFWYRLSPIRDDWEQCVRGDADQPRCASTIP